MNSRRGIILTTGSGTPLYPALSRSVQLLWVHAQLLLGATPRKTREAKRQARVWAVLGFEK